MASVLFHLGLQSKDLEGATIAVLPGDPDRVQKIALCMDSPKYISSRREFTVWLAKISDVVIIICSTGIGGPSTSIVVEELSQIGIRTFLRVGTAGVIQSYIQVGDILVVTAAVRCDGASQHFAPLEFPAVADLSCSMALLQATDRIGVNAHYGIIVSSDTFYPGQERRDTYSGYVTQKLHGSMEEWRRMRVMGYEMESATLFTMCAVQKELRAGSVLGVVVNRTQEEKPNLSLISNIEHIVIEVVIEGIRILLSKNKDVV